MTPTLRPYQQQAISDLRMAYRSGARAPLLVAPYGHGGKTVVFAAIAQAAVSPWSGKCLSLCIGVS
jgi:DNA repair protein RadD